MIAFGCSIVAAIPMQAAASAAPVDFNRDILPILSNNCFKCHGPDDHERKAKLRLDTHAGVLGSGKSGAIAVVPGQSAQSELILRITSTIEDDAMPPLDSNKKLTPAAWPRARKTCSPTRCSPISRRITFCTGTTPRESNRQRPLGNRNRLSMELLLCYPPAHRWFHF
jgi:hypothetical protein